LACAGYLQKTKFWEHKNGENQGNYKNRMKNFGGMKIEKIMRTG